jgi:DNA polymerase III gamma/tau subunit
MFLVMETISPDKKGSDLKVLLEIFGRKLHKAIDLEQVIILTAEILKDEIEARKIKNQYELIELLESISSKGTEVAQVLQDLRSRLTKDFSSTQDLSSARVVHANKTQEE